MILDIQFNHNEPKQYQNVRLATLYNYGTKDEVPELIIHFNDDLYPQMQIALNRIKTLQITND